MNYIGSKYHLVDSLIETSMRKLDIRSPGVFLDAFAGTHAVGQYMQKRGWHVRANDLMAFSSVVGRTVLHSGILGFDGLIADDIVTADMPLDRRLKHVIDTINHEIKLAHLDYHPETHGTWFIDKYCEGGKDGRLYFSNKNGRAISVIRYRLAKWSLTSIERDVLLSELLRAACRVINSASVQYTYLKKLKYSAQKDMGFAVPRMGIRTPAEVHRMDALKFVEARSGDASVLYLDPPYNQRQYAPNYHLLETITLWDNPEANGVGGVRPYQDKKSAWCSREGAARSLREILAASKAPWTMLSYSNEGLLGLDTILDIMNEHGETQVFEQPHPRFKSRKNAGCVAAPAEQVVEYLIISRKH